MSILHIRSRSKNGGSNANDNDGGTKRGASLLKVNRSVVVIGSVASLLLGIGVGAIVFAPHAPEVIDSGNITAMVSIERQDVIDARSVTIEAEDVALSPVAAPRSGMVNTSSCKPGEALHSGQSLLSIEGRGTLMLSTSEPLWRDLHIGDRGTDVKSLNDALGALGEEVPSDDIVSDRTVTAFVNVAAKAGIDLGDGYTTITMSDVTWLARDGVVVAGCPAPVGQIVGQGSAIAELPTTATSARIQKLPTDAVSGTRVIQIDDTTIGVSDDGTVEDLDALSRTRTFLASETRSGGTRTMNAQWKLKDPVTVGVVPASAVGTTGGEHAQACVVTESGSTPIRVVGSMLGRTYVQTADGGIPTGRVSVRPNDKACS